MINTLLYSGGHILLCTLTSTGHYKRFFVFFSSSKSEEEVTEAVAVNKELVEKYLAVSFCDA